MVNAFLDAVFERKGTLQAVLYEILHKLVIFFFIY